MQIKFFYIDDKGKHVVHASDFFAGDELAKDNNLIFSWVKKYMPSFESFKTLPLKLEAVVKLPEGQFELDSKEIRKISDSFNMNFSTDNITVNVVVWAADPNAIIVLDLFSYLSPFDVEEDLAETSLLLGNQVFQNQIANSSLYSSSGKCPSEVTNEWFRGPINETKSGGRIFLSFVNDEDETKVYWSSFYNMTLDQFMGKLSKDNFFSSNFEGLIPFDKKIYVDFIWYDGSQNVSNVFPKEFISIYNILKSSIINIENAVSVAKINANNDFISLGDEADSAEALFNELFLVLIDTF